MGIKEVLSKMLKKKEPEVFDDNETRDKYLRSLRRERRIQLEAEEKKHLLKIIAAYKKQKTRENLFGIAAEHNLLRNDSAIIKSIREKQNKPVWFTRRNI